MMESHDCPRQSDLDLLAAGVVHGRAEKVKEHVAGCEKCFELVDAITKQNSDLENRLACLTLDDLEAAREMLEAEIGRGIANVDSWHTDASYELAEQTSRFATPCRVGQYEIQGLIAPGGMGEVYRAKHARLKRDVAVKVIRQNQQDSPLFYENFLREIETIGQLEHPNMVRAYDALEYEGYLFLVMEFLDGDSLHALARDGAKLSLRQLMDAMIGTCRALAHLHANGYLHLDIKPANLMRVNDGTVKLIDYGLAVSFETAKSSGEIRYGTLGYMPPEQISLGIVDQRSDVFSAGKLFQFLLEKLVDDTMRLNASLPLQKTATLAEKMTEDDPLDRPDSIEEVLGCLQRIQNTSSGPTGLAVLGPGTETTSPTAGVTQVSRSGLRKNWIIAVLLLLLVLGIYAMVRNRLSGSNRLSVTLLGDLTNSIGMQLNLLPQGTLLVQKQVDVNGEVQEVAHEVAIDQPFYIGMHEVTQEQFRSVMGENPSNFKDDRLPVETVTISEAQEFCRRLSERPEEKKAGRVYRIPRSTEWEYACRAGTTSIYSFGGMAWNLDLYAWYNGNAGQPHEVGKKRANAWGLYDMHGNVSEFCWQGPDDATKTVKSDVSNGVWLVHGGSWSTNAAQCESSNFTILSQERQLNGPFSSEGFRVVCNLLPHTDVTFPLESANDTELYVIDLDLRDDPSPSVYRTTNAILYREEDTTHYWTPEEVNRWALIEYRLELPGPIDSVVEFGNLMWVYNEHYYPVFDPLAQGTLEVSRDGENWHVIFHSQSGVPLTDGRSSALPLLKGSSVVYLRARLFSSTHGKQVCFSQFLRRDNKRQPHRLQFLLRSGSGQPAEVSLEE